MEEPTRSQISCSICNQPVALETAKTDDSGQAVHEECYLFKVGITPDRGSVHEPKRMQTVDIQYGPGNKVKLSENSFTRSLPKLDGMVR